MLELIREIRSMDNIHADVGGLYQSLVVEEWLQSYPQRKWHPGPV